MKMKKTFNVNGCYKSHLPAKDGITRHGLIRKEMKIYNKSCNGNVTYSIVGVVIDTYEMTIKVQFLKGKPFVKRLFWAILADRDIRRLIVDYQKTFITRNPYEVWGILAPTGKEDIFMTFESKIGESITTNTIKLCHISSSGKLNKGFGINSMMTIGDFIELVAFMGLTENIDSSMKSLRKRACVKYIRPTFSKEISSFKTNVSKVL